MHGSLTTCVGLMLAIFWSFGFWLQVERSGKKLIIIVIMKMRMRIGIKNVIVENYDNDEYHDEDDREGGFCH